MLGAYQVGVNDCKCQKCSMLTALKLASLEEVRILI